MTNEENLRRWRSDDRAREKERQANDWRTFNEKTIKQAKTGLFIQNLCETEHPGDYERAGIFILESRRDLGRLYEMAPVRIRIFNHKSDLFFSARKQSAFFAVADPGGGGLVWEVWTPPPPNRT